MALTLNIPRSRDKKAYRLRCRFAMPAYPLPSWLEKAKVKVAEDFVEDMRKQGFEYVPSYGVTMTGPFPVVETVNLPKRSQQARWHMPAQEALQRIQAGQRIRAGGEPYVKAVPSLAMSEKWEYELAAVFAHDTILTESPDAAEEQEGLKKR